MSHHMMCDEVKVTWLAKISGEFLMA